MHTLHLKRIYEPGQKDDGLRILVDGLWPRGISKEKAQLYAWNKDVAPDRTERTAFHHGQESYAQFEQHYIHALNTSAKAQAFARQIRALLQESDVTLLYGSKDTLHNNAQVLYEWLEDQFH